MCANFSCRLREPPKLSSKAQDRASTDCRALAVHGAQIAPRTYWTTITEMLVGIYEPGATGNRPPEWPVRQPEDEGAPVAPGRPGGPVARWPGGPLHGTYANTLLRRPVITLRMIGADADRGRRT
jgi:hypothetical protein